MKTKLLTLYEQLLKYFGRQNWWPTKTKNKQFEIIVGAILTQNTAWRNVEKAIDNLIAKNLLDPKKIARAKKEKLAKLIKPAGYYNQKAERLILTARFFTKTNSLPTREQLLAIKGIGPETADSILLYAFNKPYFVIDAYTRRILSRLGLIKGNENYTELQTLFHKSLPADQELFKEYHALLVELAKRFCRKKPRCASCPIRRLCKRFI